MPGLELLPNVWILPHFDALDRYRAGLREYFLSRIPQTGVALGIDERTAVARIGSSWTVFGDGGAFVSYGPVGRRFAAGETLDPDQLLAGPEALVDRDLLLALEPIPVDAGPIALLSSEQFSDGARDVDRALLERCGPHVGVVLDADPSGANALGGQALAHYRSLDAQPRILHPEDGDAEIDVVFLAGGDPRHLVAPLQDSPLWAAVRAGWRRGLALAGSSAGAMALCERCLFADEGADVPTRWGRGLGPLRSLALAVHVSSRPPGWLEEVSSTAPVDLVAMDDGTSLLLEPARPPTLFGDGDVRRYGRAGERSEPARPGRILQR